MKIRNFNTQRNKYTQKNNVIPIGYNNTTAGEDNQEFPLAIISFNNNLVS